MPGAVLGAGETLVTTADKNPCALGASFLAGKTDKDSFLRGRGGRQSRGGRSDVSEVPSRGGTWHSFFELLLVE